MIGYLRGVLLEKKPGGILVDVGGVGYEVQVPLSTYYKLPKPGSEVALLVHTHVREDALALYGFRTAAERELFESLLGVSGIGPRVALNVLSNFAPEEVLAAVKKNNPLALIAPGTGIGRKTAERIVYELRDKAAPLPSAEPTAAAAALSAVAEEGVSALENMGADAKLARKAVQAVLQSSPGTDSFETLMKGALRWLRERKG